MGEFQNGCFKKTKHGKFSEKRTFVVLCFLETNILRFALLPHCRRNISLSRHSWDWMLRGQKNNTPFPLLASDEKKILTRQGREKFLCPFNKSLTATFHFCIPNKLNEKLNAFSKLTYKSSCDALKYLFASWF